MTPSRLIATLCLLFLLLPFVFAQAPIVDGEDSFFLEPVAPPPPASQPSPSPNRSSAPVIFPVADGSPNRTPSPIPSPPPLPSPGPEPPTKVFCKRQKLRTISGQCTSAFQSTWGESQRPQFSYLQGHTSTLPTGQLLKGAREISNILSDQKTDIFNSKGLNELFVFFGQFIDHNLVATPASDESLPIEVPAGDPKFSEGTELPFKRSSRGFTGEGSNERPINTLSSALDLSAVYGVNDLRNTYLLARDSTGELTGKMKVSVGDLLPFNTGGFNNAPNSNSARFYLTGDHRANEHPALTSIHTIFVREHNRLVDVIRTSFPERVIRRIPPLKLYEWARQINIAQFQKIVYEEFLPAMFGRKFPKYRGYRRFVDPTVSDIFAGAAYRVGHTMVGNVVSRRGPSGPLTPLTMGDVFFREFGLEDTAEVDNIIRGAANQKSQEVDLLVHDVLRNMLFDKVPLEEGFDLVALNIQRGRDHALPTYNQIRGIFRLKKAKTFKQISSDPTVAKKLEQAYGEVDNVEAWPGLVAENKARRAGIGKTMLKVWEAEFLRLSLGDQFFYLRRRKSIARRLELFLPGTIKPIFQKRKKLFREIITRNTGIKSSELPAGDIFKS